MGCVSSKQATQPRQPMAQPEEEEIQTSVVSTKASTIRARRLSYSVEANAGHLRPSLRAGPEDGEDDEELDEGKANSPTRARRLSYCAKEPRLAGRIRAEYAMYGDDGSSSGSSSQTPLAVTPTAAATGGEAAARPSKPRPVGVQVACMSRAGREPGYKKTNQDNCFAFEKYISEEQSMFGAMDGHGPHGHLVSGFVKQHLPIILVNHLTSGVSVEDALTTGFLEVDRNLASSRIDCEFSGSTCAVAYLKGKTLTTAWVGDSRMVMGRRIKRGWEAIDLSHDHKPTTPEERARILRSHGRVERLVDEAGQPMGPYRVWLQYAWVPGLAMSRALGDQLAHTVGVSSEPQHITVDLTPSDKLLILASDGVWEFISSKEAVEMVAACDTPEEGCRTLVDEAYQRWLNEEDGVVDDITAVVVRLLHSEQ